MLSIFLDLIMLIGVCIHLETWNLSCVCDIELAVPKISSD